MNNAYTTPKEKPVPKDFPQGTLSRALPAIASHPYGARDVLELDLTLHQRLHIVEAKGEWWYIARTMAGREGWVPSSYIKLLAAPSTLNMQNTYKAWAQAVQLAFHPPRPAAPTPTASTSTDSNMSKPLPFPPKLDRKTFPWLPPEICSCEEPSCWLSKQNPTGLGACRHDVETLLKGAGEEYTVAWLWKMSLKWHPDRFMRKFKENFMEEGLGAVGEMFGFLTDLANKERERERVGKT